VTGCPPGRTLLEFDAVLERDAGWWVDEYLRTLQGGLILFYKFKN